MISNSAKFLSRLIMNLCEQDMLSVQPVKDFGEILCGLHQQLQKCVLALKLRCT